MPEYQVDRSEFSSKLTLVSQNDEERNISRRGSENTIANHFTENSTPKSQEKPNENNIKDVEKQLNNNRSKDFQKNDLNIIRWNENDCENPKNWSILFRSFCTFQLGTLVFVSSMGTSIISPSSQILSEKFELPINYLIFTVTCYLLGYALGSMLWSGLSETFGRRLSLLPPMFVLAIFSIGTAVSNTPQAVFITRFFAGFFGSAAVSNVPAALGDLYPPKSRGIAVSLYAACVLGGPCIGTLVGSVLTMKVSWRWTGYLLAILAFSTTFFTFFFLPETYEPILLKERVIELRKQNENNKNLYHPQEKVKLDFQTILIKQVVRPLLFLFTEPIVTAIAFYASYIYSLLYMSLEIVPIIFSQMRGYDLIVGNLPFLAIFIGGLLAVVLNNVSNILYYNKAVDEAGGKAVPEARLPPMFIGMILFCSSLFWVGWTADPTYTVILPVIGLAILGAGYITSFQQSINFLIDSYKINCASAVAANTILRSFMAAGLPFATRPMFDALGAAKSLSILGALAGLAIPMPIIFQLYGNKLRKSSKYAQV